MTADLIIKKAEAIITAEAVQTFTYDGTVKNVSAKLNHEEAELIYTPAQGYINAGKYNVTVSSEETANYLADFRKSESGDRKSRDRRSNFQNDTFTYDGMKLIA